MTTSRLAILFVVLLGGLGSAYLIPQTANFMPMGISLELPDSIGEWWGNAVDVTQKEKSVLGPGTEFSRKDYSNGRGDQIQGSVVLSGEDMMVSIHRPERCLHAQGWEFVPGDTRLIDIPGHGKLPVVRIKNHKVVTAPDGRSVRLENICYYWFAGSKDLTSDHLERVWIDTLDRFKGGYAQRWAMLMVTSNITAGSQRFGRDEKATDALLQSFIQKLAPEVHKGTIQYQ